MDNPSAIPEQGTLLENAADQNAIVSRRIALDLLQDILSRKQSLDQAIERHKDLYSQDSRDKAFIRMMVTTTLRRLGQIDYLIDKALDKPGSLRSQILRDLLRLAVVQIAFMNVPDHASVDTAVTLCKEIGMDKQSGFVNGVLRTISRRQADWLTKLDPNRINTPEWLLKTWVNDYGLSDAARIAQAHLIEPATDIVIKKDESFVYWEKALGAQKLYGRVCRRDQGGRIEDLPGYKEGLWWVQSASAYLPASLFGAELQDQTVLDMCAAPGGKTLQLCDNGASVIALDRSPQRLKRMHQNLERLQCASRCTVHVADAAHWRPAVSEPIQKFDFILLDAPCSATGTIRKNPDILHLKGQRDIERLVQVQKDILANAYSLLNEGGVLIYCTCSLQKAEGEYQIIDFLERFDDMDREIFEPKELPGLEKMITEDGDIRVMPYHLKSEGGMDGFFISRLIKKQDQND